MNKKTKLLLFMMLIFKTSMLFSGISYAHTNKITPNKNDNSRYVATVNSMSKNSKPYILFGVKHLTKNEMNNFVSMASTSYGLGEIIERRGGIGIYSNIFDKHDIFGSLSIGEGDMIYKEDEKNGIKYTFRKNEINISVPYHNSYCSYNLNKTKEKIQLTHRYILKDTPVCFKEGKAFPYIIYITVNKE